MFIYGMNIDPNNTKAVVSKPSWEFYDLQKDPKELRNLYNEPQYVDTIKDMKLELVKLREQYDDTDSNYPKLQQLLEQEGLTTNAQL